MTSTSLRHLVWPTAMFLLLAACTGSPDTASSVPEDASTSAAAVTSTVPTAPSTTEHQEAVTTTAQGPINVEAVSEDELQPGTYYVDPDGDTDTTLRGEFTVTDDGWGPFVGTNKQGPTDSAGYVAMKVLAVTQVASAGCDGTVWEPVGASAEDLAVALGGIDDFITQVAPAPVHAYGYDGYHLVLEVPDLGNEVWQEFVECDDGYFDGYEGPTLSRFYQGPNQVVEFWAIDVEGTTLLVEATWFPHSPAEDVTALRAILDSLVIRP